MTDKSIYKKRQTERKTDRQMKDNKRKQEECTIKHTNQEKKIPRLRFEQKKHTTPEPRQTSTGVGARDKASESTRQSPDTDVRRANTHSPGCLTTQTHRKTRTTKKTK